DRFGDPQTDGQPRHTFKQSLEILARDSKREPSAAKQRRKEAERQRAIAADSRLAWLDRLGLPCQVWGELKESWFTAGDKSRKHCLTLVPSELAIPRVRTEDFTAPGETHHAVRLQRTEVEQRGNATERRYAVRKPDSEK
ncbi:MAG: hypothetical protein AAFX50_15245, partial [Acidobacteriota bacterium]